MIILSKILGFLKKIIKVSFMAVYKVIKLFNLVFTLFLCLSGVIIYVLGGFNNVIVLMVFCILTALSVLYAVGKTLSNIFGGNKRQGSGVTIVKQKQKKGIFRKRDTVEQNDFGQDDLQPNLTTNEQEIDQDDDGSFSSQTQSNQNENENGFRNDLTNEKPKYYRVKQDPNYLMAEYSDRYELFFVTNSGLVKVRTDPK